MSFDGAVLVTGATGFIGSALVRRLVTCGFSVRAAIRGTHAMLPSPVAVASGLGLEPDQNWRLALSGCSAVIHTAARVHVMQRRGQKALDEYRRVNVEGTAAIARQAAAAGVRRFVFVSTVKVNGEHTEPGRPFTEIDAPAPADAYARSKHEAECLLLDTSQRTGMELVIVRPVLVYGPGVRANFLAMMKWVRRGVPLPIGAVDNKRSLVGLTNLTDFLIACVQESAAAGQTFFVSDDDDMSTPELARRVGDAMGVFPRLIRVPPRALELAASMLAKRAALRRLTQSLQVDIGKAKRLLGWSPPSSVDDELRRTAAWYTSAGMVNG